jgi:hypothetical protein
MMETCSLRTEKNFLMTPSIDAISGCLESIEYLCRKKSELDKKVMWAVEPDRHAKVHITISDIGHYSALLA